MTKKIFISIFSVSLLILFLSTGIVLYFIYNNSLNLSFKDMKNEVGIFEQIYYDQGDLSKINFPDRITLIGNSGEVLYDNKVDAFKLSNHGKRSEVIEAKEYGRSEIKRYSSSTDTMSLYYAEKLSDGNILRISKSRETYLNLFFSMRIEMAIGTLLTILLSFFISKNLSKKIVEPLGKVDINNIDDENIYEEMAPFIKYIKKQNKTLKNNSDEISKKNLELESIISNMNEGILVLDKDFKIITYNKIATTIFNIDKPMFGENVYLINNIQYITDCLDRLSNGKDAIYEIRKDDYIYRVTASLIANENIIVGYAIYFFDITEISNNEEMRRTFTSNVSHELKTPLTSISGYAEIIGNDIAKREDIKKFAKTIYKEAQKLIVMVTDIIKISKLESEQNIEKYETFNINKFIAEIFESLKLQAEKNNVSLIQEGGDFELNTGKDLLREILFNLIDNGIKYNISGGFVKVISRKIGNKIVIEVQDNGQGISKGDINRIFERFYRGDKSRSKEIEGTGLGLSIVKHGVNLLGGSIEVKRDELTRFIIVLDEKSQF